ncbi:PTS sugar transporter subunit IIB [Lacticaseibacillus pantheris]|jgi:PTS system cellobiose-specific IIB component|uniref:PTS sugar transporter subunit IIB n=1 Tax=Lacticaseibacillus pantheris TaxID=171523 RepID=UPI0026590D59|nr:transcription antiterminator [Lacticaseibacillus pantheris]WKF85232.1 transcription antiterminator [Lacticaseibacillus pantheris]
MSQLKIALFCSGGMSSSLAGKRLQQEYDKIGKDVDVEAYDFGMIDEIGGDVDVIMIAPQISWATDQVKEEFPDTKVITLSIAQFGSMDGEVLAKVLEDEGVE